ncbi:MAG: cytidine deaminase [Chloroflexi bacterium]|nr:cytidine deaminase [Chloroflexota bacterium]
MPQPSLHVVPIPAPIQHASFDLMATLSESLRSSEEALLEGDVLAISSKYVAISQGRMVLLDSVEVSNEAAEMASRYHMDARVAQLVLQEAEHVLGGIQLGYALTAQHGIIAANAGIDRSNIPAGYAVLLPTTPYQTAAKIRQALRVQSGQDIGVVLTDSWLMPGRLGTIGIAVASAGFSPIIDERGQLDLFANPMAVTQRGIADAISTCAQMVMGERDEATPFAIVRNSGVVLCDDDITAADVAIPWHQCLYIESLTTGRWKI